MECAVALPMARLDAVLRNVIHSHMTDAGNWRRWWAEAGLDPPVPAPAYVYDDTAVAMQAVLRGQGVILGRSPLVADDVAAGRLVRLSANAVASRERNYLVSLERVRNRPALRAFRDWLLAEAAG